MRKRDIACVSLASVSADNNSRYETAEKNFGRNRVLMGKPEIKRPLGRPRRSWKQIRSNFKQTGWDGMDLIDLAEDWGK